MSYIYEPQVFMQLFQGRDVLKQCTNSVLINELERDFLPKYMCAKFFLNRANWWLLRPLSIIFQRQLKVRLY